MASEPEELKASDLLPPDDPPPSDTPKKIAERRVVGWFMADRLVRRAEWRPVGNSKHFWSKIEDDDPFVHRPPPRRVRQEHTLYPADRIDRIPSTAVPQSPRPKAPPQPRQEAPRPERQAPKPPAVNRDPRVASTPSTPQTPIQETPPPPMERHLPPVKPPKRTKTGRIRISSAKERPHGHQGMVKRPSAAEIRAQKEASREAGTLKDAAPPKLRKLDDVLGVLGRLKQAQELHAQGLLDKENFDAGSDDAPRPKPKRVAQPTPRSEAPRPTPKPKAPPKPVAPPKPSPPEIDRTPPKPAAPKKKAEPKGPPRPPSGGMDDLFGAPSEGRVKIGKRTKPTAKPVDDGSD